MEEQRTKFSPYKKSEATLERKRQWEEKELEWTETLATQSKPRRNTLESRGFPERGGMRQAGPQSSPGACFEGAILELAPWKENCYPGVSSLEEPTFQGRGLMVSFCFRVCRVQGPQDEAHNTMCELR